jgi:hypothetical protein
MADERTWRKPELIVLVRSRPEEAVLFACKNGGSTPVGPNYDNVRCILNGSSCGTTCDGWGAS